MRTFSTCFGRWRSTADFQQPVTCPAISQRQDQTDDERTRPESAKKSALTPIAMNNGSQICASLSAAMNKSSAGLVHCSINEMKKRLVHAMK